MRLDVLALYSVLCTIGLAQDSSPGTDAKENPSAVPDTITENKSKLPLEIAGYLSFRRLNDDVLQKHHFYNEYSGSLFLNKTLGRWRFHSEFNAGDGIEHESEGLHFLSRPSLTVKLDSAFANYNARDWFQVQGGFIFIPTYWRTHRYQSTTLTVAEPMMDQSVFPTAFKGLAIHGDKYFEAGGLSYELYGGVSQEQHFTNLAVDQSRALGGKLVLHVPSWHFFQTFDVGFHRLHELFPGQRRDQSNGVELLVEKGGFSLLSEFAHSSIRPVNGTAGHFRQGFYVQPWYAITPKLYVVLRYEALDRDNRRPDRNALWKETAGLTYRPLAALSLKMDVNRYEPERGYLAAYSGITWAAVYFFHLP